MINIPLSIPEKLLIFCSLSNDHYIKKYAMQETLNSHRGEK